MISLLFSKKCVNFTPKYNLIVAAFEIIQNKGGIKNPSGKWLQKRPPSESFTHHSKPPFRQWCSVL